jgi:hypothetical protein
MLMIFSSLKRIAQWRKMCDRSKVAIGYHDLIEAPFPSKSKK